jgi:hypothetical protein
MNCPFKSHLMTWETYTKVVRVCTECTKHYEHLPNIQFHPLLPSEQPQFVGHGLYKVSKAFHRDAGPYWLQCFPQLCQVGWMSFGWWTILDTHRKLLSVKNPAVLQFLTQTGVPGTYHHTPFKGTSIFCLAHHPLNSTHTQSMSQLSQGFKIII